MEKIARIFLSSANVVNMCCINSSEATENVSIDNRLDYKLKT